VAAERKGAGIPEPLEEWTGGGDSQVVGVGDATGGGDTYEDALDRAKRAAPGGGKAIKSASSLLKVGLSAVGDMVKNVEARKDSLDLLLLGASWELASRGLLLPPEQATLWMFGRIKGVLGVGLEESTGVVDILTSVVGEEAAGIEPIYDPDDAASAVAAAAVAVGEAPSPNAPLVNVHPSATSTSSPAILIYILAHPTPTTSKAKTVVVPPSWRFVGVISGGSSSLSVPLDSLMVQDPPTPLDDGEYSLAFFLGGNPGANPPQQFPPLYSLLLGESRLLYVRGGGALTTSSSSSTATLQG